MAAPTATFRPRELRLGTAKVHTRNMALAGWSLLAFVALALVARRAAGGLAAPSQPAVLWLAAAALALAAVVIHLLSGKKFRVPGVEQREPPVELALPSALFHVGVTAAIITAGLALSWPIHSAAGTVGIWVVLLVGEVAGWSLSRFRLPAGTLHAHRALNSRSRPAGETYDYAAGGFASLRPPPPDFAAPHDDAEIQQLTRRRLPDGGEQVEGWLAAELAPAQRTTALHVAFCPPLASVPTITLRQLAGPPARLRVVQSLPYGAKLEVKLESAASEQVVVRVAVMAEAVPAAGRLPSGEQPE